MGCMGRPLRVAQKGFAYHVVNRGVHRQMLFESSSDYLQFQQLMVRACSRVAIRLIAYCLMKNHWHLVLWPKTDAALSAYIHWLTGVHARYFNAARGLKGHVYQSRFYSVPIADERHLWVVLRYVESNPVRAGLVHRAENWRWSSVTPFAGLRLAPFKRPPNWLDLLADRLADTQPVVPGTVKTETLP